ncbi:serine hydrolase domain-containing protein [Sphingomonas sp.]|uniref:serine hydrolase domain-containing protein n=1 Tax=Sphingomonas sp. TaxID=28214 RepID=UPI003AFFA077
MIDHAFAPVAAALASGAIPGAALGIVTADGRVETRVAGHAAIEPTPEPLTPDHWFDLASLTKPIFTATAILTLARQGRLDLDRPLTDAIPDLRQYDPAAPERRLTFRRCLAHATHLPAVEPIYTYGSDPATLRAFILQREWRSGPPAYSDINYLLLGIAIERLTGAPLDRWPLGDGLSWGAPPGPAVSTERCTWRGRVLRGEVHDENAWALGGRAGHAGLFGTLAGVLGFAQALLADAPCEVRDTVHATRTCGWDKAHPGWPGSDACSPGTIGHTGFTGTGLWLDFDRGVAWTLLTNRIHPTRHSAAAQSIFALRSAVGEAVVSAFDAGRPRDVALPFS